MKRKGNDISEDDLFKMYAINYSSSDDLKDDERQKVNRQKAIYKIINKKKLENTSIPELLSITINDIEKQYNVKESLETKTGIIVALWGVVICFFFDQLPWSIISRIQRLIEGGKLVYGIFDILLIFGFIVLNIFIGLTIYASFATLNYRKPSLYNREINYMSAALDKDIFTVRFLEMHTNIWEENEKCNGKKAKYFNRLVALIIGLIGYVLVYSIYRHI